MGDATGGAPVDPVGEEIVDVRFRDAAKVARNHIKWARGGALCVLVDGRPVLDIWDGPKNPAVGSTWEADTMGMAFSVSKGVMSTLIHQLIERGQVDVNAPVAEYWPEFAAAGKGGITIRHVLAMEAGLYDIRNLVDDPELMLDWAAMTALLAAATPHHPPGAANAYHALTYGWLLGEVARRVTGHSVRELVQRELAEPLGLDGFHIGVPDAELARVAARPTLIPENQVIRGMAKGVDPILRLAGFSPRRMAEAFVPRNANDVMSGDRFLQAEVPSANGVYTARSLARFYGALGSDDGLDGVQLWSPETRKRATTIQNRRRDRVVVIPMRWQLGFHQPFPRRKTAPNSFGFYGAFGSGAFADPDRKLALGFVCRQAAGMSLLRIVPAVLKAIDG